MGEQALTDLDREALKAVEQYCYDRHADLTPWNLIGPNEEARLKLATDAKGHCVIEFRDIHIDEKEDDTWYIAATCFFQLKNGDEDQGSTDIYECYQDDTGKWIVSWYAE